MVSFIDLTNAMVATLQKIPELVALLDQGQPGIAGYIDENPLRNSFSKAIYQMPAGSILLIWQGTTLELAATTMEAWVHVVQIYVKARRGDSAMLLMHTLVEGVPVPGDGLRWRYCPVMDGVLPTGVRDISRLIDEEGIDYFVATTVTQETGDT